MTLECRLQVNLLAQAVKDQGGNPAHVLGADGGHISPPSSFDPAEIEDKYARQLAALMSKNRELTAEVRPDGPVVLCILISFDNVLALTEWGNAAQLEAQQRGTGQDRDGRLERELMNEKSKAYEAQQRLGELEASEKD